VEISSSYEKKILLSFVAVVEFAVWFITNLLELQMALQSIYKKRLNEVA